METTWTNVETRNSSAAESLLCADNDSHHNWGLFRAWSSRNYQGRGVHHRLGQYQGTTIGPRFDTAKQACEWASANHTDTHYILAKKIGAHWRLTDASNTRGPHLHLINDPGPHRTENCFFTDEGVAWADGTIELFNHDLEDFSHTNPLAELLIDYGNAFSIP